MTEPKHIPLTARLRKYAQGWAEEFRGIDDRPALDDDVPEEED